MPSAKNRVAIPGSERTTPPGIRVGPVDPNERIEVTIHVRSRPSSKGMPSAEEVGVVPPRDRHYLQREEFEAAHGADPKDVAKIEAFAHEHSLEIVEVSAARRSVVLSGTVANISDAFGVDMARYEHSGNTFRGRSGAVHVPAELAPIVEGVFGLDDRRQANPHFRRLKEQEGLGPRVPSSSYTPPQIATLYDFPPGVNGQGQCIAIIELGGGYRTSDLKAYFTQLGTPEPQVSAVLVDHGHNQPTTPDSADGEVMLDIEVAGAIAHGARIVVFFAPNTDRGFLDAITTAIHDSIHKPSVISISWGAAETQWTQQAMKAFDQVFQAAAALGVTVCCASGDDGSNDGMNDGRAHVDFPASSPFALACGGTRVESAANKITSEVVWNDGANGGASGGGVSEVFALPTWQNSANVPPSVNPGGFKGRGVPDVSGDASPASGYRVLVDGQQTVIGGTSAVAPLWAGLIALINQHLGQPIGYLTPLLYGGLAAAGVFRDIVTGDNGEYRALPGWDACTGWGSSDGARLMSAP